MTLAERIIRAALAEAEGSDGGEYAPRFCAAFVAGVRAFLRERER